MNVLLDLDGTLTDPRVGIVASIQYALIKLGHEPPVDSTLVHLIGPPLRESFGDLLTTTDATLVERAMAFYRERYSAIGLLENEVYPGIPEALASLRARGDTLFVATSKPEPFAIRILEHFNLAQHFRRIYGSELTGERSDKTSLISYVIKKEKINRTETVMVGDRSHDAIGARANGVVPVGVLWGYGNEEELIAAHCRVLLRTPPQLSRLVI